MDYLQVANGGLLGILCASVVIVVFIQAWIFLAKAWKRGKEIKMNPTTMKKVVTNAAVFSIIPSLPILIFLLLLMPTLGQFFPWLRLSVIGSGAYENLVANMTAQSFGLASVNEGMTTTIFLGILWTMTLGIIFEPFLTLFGAKFVQKGLQVIKGKNADMANVVLNCLMIALYCIFAGPSIAAILNITTVGASALIPIICLFVGGLGTILFTVIAEKTNKSVFREFSFPLSLLLGMVAAIIFNPILAG